MESYNYPIFPTDMDNSAFDAFPKLLKVGQAAPDAQVTRLPEGQPVQLSEYWNRKFLVIEFGSLT